MGKTGGDQLSKSITENGRGRVIMAVSDGKGGWTRSDLSSQLPADLRGNDLMK